MTKCNLIRRLGSKKMDIKYFDKYLPYDCETVVEPFSGGFSVTKHYLNKQKTQE